MARFGKARDLQLPTQIKTVGCPLRLRRDRKDALPKKRTSVSSLSASHSKAHRGLMSALPEQQDASDRWLGSLRADLMSHAMHGRRLQSADAADLVQDAMLRLLRYVAQRRQLGELRALAFRILDNTIVSYGRAEVRRRRACGPLTDGVEKSSLHSHRDQGWTTRVFDHLEAYGLRERLTSFQAVVYDGLRAGNDVTQIAVALNKTKKDIADARLRIIKKARGIVMEAPQVCDVYEIERRI